MAPAFGPIAAITSKPLIESAGACRGTHFFALGNLGQIIVILPSQQLVIVRLGDSVDPLGEMRGLARLVREVLSATPR
jgi:CubicO group peptidase (beta-lactamase class C family)